MPDRPKDDKDLSKLKRDELDEVAADAGVPAPETLPNKEAVVEAIEAPNPALAPVPEPAPDPAVLAPQPDPEVPTGEQGYEVVGDRSVLGHEPGSKFAAAIPAAQEALLIESGHIKRLNLED